MERKNKAGIRDTLIANLKYYRERKGISQGKLSELIDKGTSYLSSVESKKRGMSLESVEDLATVLDVPYHKLVMERDEISYPDYDKEDFLIELREEFSDFFENKLQAFSDGMKKK